MDFRHKLLSVSPVPMPIAFFIAHRAACVNHDVTGPLPVASPTAVATNRSLLVWGRITRATRTIRPDRNQAATSGVALFLICMFKGKDIHLHPRSVRHPPHTSVASLLLWGRITRAPREPFGLTGVRPLPQGWHCFSSACSKGRIFTRIREASAALHMFL
jgi:hypothetical protein